MRYVATMVLACFIVWLLLGIQPSGYGYPNKYVLSYPPTACFGIRTPGRVERPTLIFTQAWPPLTNFWGIPGDD
jgi:hypothetical protein